MLFLQNHLLRALPLHEFFTDLKAGVTHNALFPITRWFILTNVISIFPKTPTVQWIAQGHTVHKYFPVVPRPLHSLTQHCSYRRAFSYPRGGQALRPLMPPHLLPLWVLFVMLLFLLSLPKLFKTCKKGSEWTVLSCYEVCALHEFHSRFSLCEG